MRLAVLCLPESWYLRDLRRAAGDRHQIESVAFHQLRADQSIVGREGFGSGRFDLVEFDAVLVRTMPPGSLEQIVFRMDVLGRLEQSGVVVLNPPRAIEAAVDKYLALARLREAGLPTPRTWVCQTLEDAMDGYERLGGDVVVKPLFGGEGRGILRVEDPALARRVFATLVQLNSVIYLQEFVPHHGYDLRLLVVGDEVIAMRRRNADDWRTNISRGAVPEPVEPGDEPVAMARLAARAIGAPIAGVDVLPGKDGRLYLLEVNAVPGWRALAQTAGCDIARLILDFTEAAAGRASSGTQRPDPGAAFR